MTVNNIDASKHVMMYYAEKLSDNMEKTPEGFLVCRNVSLARTGLMDYHNQGQIEGNDDEIVRIGHNAETLSSAETIASFEGKAITLEHPPVMLDPDNISDYSVGHLQNVVFDEERQTLSSDLVIVTTEAIKLVKNGLREVSCGYWADVEPNADGTGTLINVIGNHLALVANGRCGSKCSINDNREISMTEKESLFKKLAALFDSEEKEPETPVMGEDYSDEDDEDVSAFDAKSAFDDLAKRLDDLEAKFAPKDDEDEDEDAPVTPSKEDQILALLNKLLEMEAKEQKQADEDDTDEDDDDDSFKDSLEIKITAEELNDSMYKTPSISQLNEMYAKHFGGK